MNYTKFKPHKITSAIAELLIIADVSINHKLMNIQCKSCTTASVNLKKKMKIQNHKNCSNNLTKYSLVISILQRQPNDEQYVIMVLNYMSSNTDVCSLYSSTALYQL